MAFEPVIKWSGSKRSQADEILKYFPNEINTYYEPFCGGASIFRKLISSNIDVKHYILSDINPDLINLFQAIKTIPHEVGQHYTKLWSQLNSDNDIDRKKDYFASIRDRYNKDHNPLDFMFIMRTTTNGMPRYNSNGEFNNSFHVTRNGIIPESLCKIIYEWSDIINSKDVQFKNCSYLDVKPSKGDFIYLDPPYANTKGMYYGGIDCDALWEYLRNIECPYVLSFDGVSGEKDNTYNVPIDIYDNHVYLKSGNSSFKRVIGMSRDSMVFESLYTKGVEKKDIKKDKIHLF